MGPDTWPVMLIGVRPEQNAHTTAAPPHPKGLAVCWGGEENVLVMGDGFSSALEATTAH